MSIFLLSTLTTSETAARTADQINEFAQSQPGYSWPMHAEVRSLECGQAKVSVSLAHTDYRQAAEQILEAAGLTSVI